MNKLFLAVVAVVASLVVASFVFVFFSTRPVTTSAVGIVELENGLRIPGMIQGAPQDQLKVGMALTIDFGTCNTTQPRYCFKPA